MQEGELGHSFTTHGEIQPYASSFVKGLLAFHEGSVQPTFAKGVQADHARPSMIRLRSQLAHAARTRQL
eukprot:2350607-Amphidinium_carterae.2